MLRPFLQYLLLELDTNSYKTAQMLAEHMKISEKTVRIRLKELDSILSSYGAGITSKPRYGYILEVYDLEKFSRFNEENASKESSKMPNSNDERVNYLLVYLLNHDGYIKTEELCDFLYVSQSTMTRTLKQLEIILDRYGISIDRRPNYGIGIKGDEIKIRRCLVEHYTKRDYLTGINGKEKEKKIAKIAKIVLNQLQSYNIKLSEVALENLVSYMYTARARIQRGKLVQLKKAEIIGLREDEWKFVESLVKIMEENFRIKYNEAEEAYIALHLASKRTLGYGEQEENNLVIQCEIDQLVNRMLNIIYSEFGFDFRHSLDLRMNLNQHMVPFDIRMKYDIPLNNPMLEDIKSNYKLAYWMATTAAAVLEEYYEKEIKEDEIGYFALIFALSIEKENTVVEKKSILIVCATGKGSSQLIKYKYEQEFKDYINQIYVCDLMELDSFDFSQVELVVTTVTINRYIPVPIIEVGLFFEESDINNVKKRLKSKKKDYLDKFYSPDTFLYNIGGKTKEEVLFQMCEKISKQKNVPEDFYQLIMEREYLNSTDYGNLVAIPHPSRTVVEESFVYIAVLESEIIWERNPVKVVFLTVVGSQPDSDLIKFYHSLTELLQSKVAVQTLIERNNYETLMSLLYSMNA